MKLSELDVKECIELYNTESVSIQELANKKNVSYNTLRNKMKQKGWIRRKFMLEKKDIVIIEKRVNSGETLESIAKSFNVNARTISSFLIKHNSQSKPSMRRHKLDHDYFKNIDTERKAYWLGFIAADGNVIYNQTKYKVVYAFGIELQMRDKDHLIQLKKDLSYSGRIYDRVAKNTCYIKINSKVFVENLIKASIIPKKSKIYKPLLSLDKKLIPHYVRGYFDGDGCISVKCTKTLGDDNLIKYTGICTISGTKDLLSYINHYYNFNKPFERKNSKGCFVISASELDTLTSFYKRVYDNSTIHLDRKKEKFDILIGNFQSQQCPILEKFLKSKQSELLGNHESDNQQPTASSEGSTTTALCSKEMI